MKKYKRITASSEEVLKSKVAQRVLANLKKYNLLHSDVIPEIVNTKEEARKVSFESLSQPKPLNHPVAYGKKVLHLAEFEGSFTKQCPGTNQMLCCQYHVINMISNCPFDCSYCYLQTYLNQPMTTIYTNEEDVHNQVIKLCEHYEAAYEKKLVGGNKRLPLRIGTGEIADSLALDPITEFSRNLSEVVSRFPNVRLELKTKSKNIEHLLDLKRKDHVVIAFSVNPQKIVQAEEHGTASFYERIRAASIAAQAGFGVAFHFDPIIHFENWQEEYRNAVEFLLRSVPEESIQWISMGSLRYHSNLKAIALQRYPDSKIFFEDTILADDGKYRYLRKLRSDMYQYINKVIGEFSPKAYTYLCMENRAVWEKSLDRMPDRGF